MTRLIDGDDLEKTIYEWMPKDQETWMGSKIPPIENLVISIMMTIQEQPTVDAIPIEWIEKYVESKTALLGDSELWMKWMIDDWQKEQEKQNEKT